jgi:N-acetylglucosamine malate deacetylase 1
MKNKNLKLDALFFAAHPDDAELCSGGTIKKLTNSGKKTGIIDLTSGELGTRGTKEIRAREAEKAGKVLGIAVRENLLIPDGSIENNLPNRLKVISVIRKYQPEIIFFPHYHDRHPDHYHTHILVKEAAFYSGLSKILTPGLAAFRPKRNFYYMQAYTFEPNVIIDISDTFNDKMKAISCYSTQFYNPKSKEPETYISDKKFIEYIHTRAKFYGFHIGTEYGEPFYTEEKIKIDINNLFNT